MAKTIGHLSIYMHTEYLLRVCILYTTVKVKALCDGILLQIQPKRKSLVIFCRGSDLDFMDKGFG